MALSTLRYENEFNIRLMPNIRQQFIELKDLVLWDENARFPDKYFNKPDEELIEYICSKKNFKIIDLAESIVKEFDLPQLEKIVIYSLNGNNIVLEGNRRLVAYKLLNNPDLIKNPQTKNKLIELKSKIDINDNFKLECLVTDDIEQGFRYIERKHLNNNHEVAWGDNERTHHKARRGKASAKELFKVEITKIVKDLDLPTAMKESVLGHGYVTNFWRILESEPAWKEYGFKIDSEGKLQMQDKNFKDKLKVIILNVLQKQDFSGNKIDSRSLNKNKEKEEYIKSISNEDIKKVESEIKNQTKENIFGDETIEIKPINQKRSNPKSTTRSYLIPKTCILEISETKINNIYRELKNDLLLDDSLRAVPNAVGVLFRVFLEISIDCFWEKNGFTFKTDTKLAGKITLAADFMEKNKIAETKQLKNIRTVATDKNNLLAIENFHSYVHSYKSQPTSSTLKLKWDNLQEFFEILWSSLKSKK